MRIATSTLSQFVLNGSQNSQQQLAQLEQDVSTGNDVTQASDNPLAYDEASQTQATVAQLNGYSNAISSATTATTANNSAMTEIYKLVSQASENATSVSSTMSTSQIKAVGTQASSLLSQLTSIVNQQDSNGNYLFGGTNNQPPIDTSTGTYNTSANGATTSTEVSPGNSVQTSIAAGHPGTPPADGFLYDSSTGVDVLAALKQTVTDLNNGDASAVQNDLPALTNALNLISSYVGSTSANMSAVSTASTANQSQITSEDNHLNTLTQTNLPNATVQLQQIQNQYEATLEAGSRILGLSILNYLGSTTTG